MLVDILKNSSVEFFQQAGPFSAKKVKEVSILEPLYEIVSLFPDVQIMW
jgi:hypothetical protein